MSAAVGRCSNTSDSIRTCAFRATNQLKARRIFARWLSKATFWGRQPPAAAVSGRPLSGVTKPRGRTTFR